MRDASVKSARATKALASRLGLDFADKRDLSLPGPLRLQPVAEHASRGARLAMSGLWRGHRAHRLVVGDYVLEALELPVSMPTLMLVPADRPATEVPQAGPSGVGDVEFDLRWHVLAADARLVAELLASPVREVLMHDAARGAAITFDGPLVYLWRDLRSAVLADTQNRLDLLAILLSRVPGEFWARYGVAAAPPLPTPAPIAQAPASAPAPAQTFAPTGAFQPAPAEEEAGYLSAGFHSRGGDPYAAPVSHVTGVATPAYGVPAAPPAAPAPSFAPTPGPEAVGTFAPQPAPASGTFAPTPQPQAPASPAFPGAPAPTGTFAPAGSFAPDPSISVDDGPGWIGGDNQNDLYWSTGPRIRGQARMRG